MHNESTDPHLNIFRRFGIPDENQEYENNVTHALINALRLSDPRITRSLLIKLIPEIYNIPIDWADIGWGLQRPPHSPESFDNRVVLGVSVSGHMHLASLSEMQEDTAEEYEPISIAPEEQGRGIPDAWIYTKSSRTLCALIEIKTRSGMSVDQTLRHESTHFANREATLVRIDIKWSDLSNALNQAYNQFPNPVLKELLEFLSNEGLTATFCFDDITVRRANGKLPKDVAEHLANRLREQLKLGPDDLVTWPEWSPHVLIFRNFEAVGNIEVWLTGQFPNVDVMTSLSFGTATPRHNRLSMPDQIVRLRDNLANPELQARAIRTLEAISPPPVWTVLDRLQRVQTANWHARGSNEIVGLLKATGRTDIAEPTGCYGEDHEIPFSNLSQVSQGLQILHRAGMIQEGSWRNFRIFARAYLGYLCVPAYGRAPQDVLPQLLEHCMRWHEALRVLSNATYKLSNNQRKTV